MKLTTAARNALPSSAFVFPAQRAYPIHDENHARDALARVAQNGSPSEKAKVRAAVKKRYPGIDSGDSGGVHANAAPMAKRPM